MTLKKVYFLLTFINSILDEVVGQKTYTFIDGYSKYNQIAIAPKDCYKITFITFKGTFMFLIISFELCNAFSVFQRAMTFVFLDFLYDFDNIHR